MKNDARVRSALRMLIVGVLLICTGVQAAYKPVDISDIKGEQRKQLAELNAALRRMPLISRDCYICEQLGLCFDRDGNRVLTKTSDGYPATTNFDNAVFVGSEGKVMRWRDAAKAAGGGEWSKCYEATKRFKAEAPLVPFRKEVQRVVCNTAKFLLETMPKEQRWMILASMKDMLYNEGGAYDRARDTPWGMENGIMLKAPNWEGQGYKYVGSDGKEYDVREQVKNRAANMWRWRQIVWRCENLVGAKNILALFPEEVKSMYTHYKQRRLQAKTLDREKAEELLHAADAAMVTLPDNKRFVRIAMAMGLYYLDHKNAGYANGQIDSKTTFILPDGTKHSGGEFAGETPGLLQQIPHEMLLEHYPESIEQMVRKVAEERFKELPSMLRDLLRAELAGKLVRHDGTRAKVKEGTSPVQTFDRTWQVPMDVPVDREQTYFRSSTGQSFPFSMYNAYEQGYGQTLKLVHLCVRILGKAGTLKLIPPGDGDEMQAEQRWAWLAEKMGFCYAGDGADAYQSVRTANENAVYVDAQGKVRRLAEAPGKDSPGWAEATNTALAMGFDKYTAPYVEEIKQLAARTSRNILASMPPELRQSWLADRNKFFFMSDSGDPYYRDEKPTLESGIEFSFRGTSWNYGKCLYYDSSGKLVSTTRVERVWSKRWSLLYYCEVVAGIDAINQPFREEVDAMRAAFKRSPFSKK